MPQINNNLNLDPTTYKASWDLPDRGDGINCSVGWTNATSLFALLYCECSYRTTTHCDQGIFKKGVNEYIHGLILKYMTKVSLCVVFAVIMSKNSGRDVLHRGQRQRLGRSSKKECSGKTQRYLADFCV